MRTRIRSTGHTAAFGESKSPNACANYLHRAKKRDQDSGSERLRQKTEGISIARARPFPVRLCDVVWCDPGDESRVRDFLARNNCWTFERRSE